jgi:hypothetical protein
MYSHMTDQEGEEPMVLGVKGRTLDLLDDQRAEIARIVKKRSRHAKQFNAQLPSAGASLKNLIGAEDGRTTAAFRDPNNEKKVHLPLYATALVGAVGLL